MMNVSLPLSKVRPEQEEIALVAPEAALERIEQAPKHTQFLVDFDETLWLRNSTESFLATLKPRFIVAMLLQLLNMIRPWAWKRDGRSEGRRDYYRIKIILFFIPSAQQQWQQVAEQFAKQHINLPLWNALQQKQHKRIYIVSYGFDFILKPLLDAFPADLNLLVAASLDPHSPHHALTLRAKGKAKACQQQLQQHDLSKCFAISDSLMDRDLLAQCGSKTFCKWPNAAFIQAGLTPMFPLLFTKKVNRPNENYIGRAILGHDYLGLMMVFALYSAAPLACAVSLLLFVLAYFTIYEVGYHENDTLGLRYEEKPRVSDQFLQYGDCFSPLFAWCCGLLLALPAAWLANSAGISWLPEFYGLQGFSATLAIWATFVALVASVRAVFFYFNRISVTGRLLPMLFLQMGRYCGYVLIFPLNMVGAVFCLSWALGKWLPYMLYRFGGDPEGYPNHLVTALLMLSMLSMSALHLPDLNVLLEPTSLILITYTLLRAGKDLLSFQEHLLLR